MFPRYSPHMGTPTKLKQSNVKVGPRALVLADLKEHGTGRLDQGNQVKATEYARAHNVIEAGGDMVRVRATVWIVIGDDSPLDGEEADGAIYRAMAGAE